MKKIRISKIITKDAIISDGAFVTVLRNTVIERRYEEEWIVEAKCKVKLERAYNPVELTDILHCNLETLERRGLIDDYCYYYSWADEEEWAARDVLVASIRIVQTNERVLIACIRAKGNDGIYHGKNTYYFIPTVFIWPSRSLFPLSEKVTVMDAIDAFGFFDVFANIESQECFLSGKVW